MRLVSRPATMLTAHAAVPQRIPGIVVAMHAPPRSSPHIAASVSTVTDLVYQCDLAWLSARLLLGKRCLKQPISRESTGPD